MSSSNPAAGARRGGARMPALEQTLSGRHLLVTGATGFLGKVFLYVLLRRHPGVGRISLLIRGDRRSAANRFRREILDSPVFSRLRDQIGNRFDRFIEAKIAILPGDITQKGLLAPEQGSLGRNTVDAVVHCAGLVNFEASLEKGLLANTLGVANVIEFCRDSGAALLHISTCYVAGSADGNRFEDEVPVDWCPAQRKRFNLQREIRDALAAVERIEAASHDQVTLAELSGASADGDDPSGHDAPSEAARKRWIEEQLKREGLERSLRLGWPNTYSYSKSLGEQLVFAARHEIACTVVRPAVIESALRDPFPGWNQGVNTSAPLAYLAGKGFRFYPARAELVLDVIPVDLVAHAMVPILAALIARHHQAVYQLGTSDCNPFRMRQLVELTALANREEYRRGRSALGALSRHLEPVVVSDATYAMATTILPAVVKQALSAGETIFNGRSSARIRQIRQRLDKVFEQLDLAHAMVEVYRPYIQELRYTFHCRNIRRLYQELRESDGRLHPYAPERIDWHDYWINVHLPGLRRHCFPQLEFHTRGRGRAVRRHRNLAELLERAAERHPSRRALVGRTASGIETALSYRELFDRVKRASLMLAGRGIKPGDRVLLMGENSPDWVVAFFAIIFAGATAVPVDHHISANEIKPLAAIAEPRAVLCSDAVAKRLEERLAEATAGAMEIRFEELKKPFLLRAREPKAVHPGRETVASIVFTSGTTGAAKGVMLTHGSFTAEVATLSRVYTLGEDDVVLSLLPLHHTFEFTCGMLLPLASGASIVYPLGVDAGSLSRTLAEVAPTALIAVPALWEAIHRRIVERIESRGVFFQAAFDQLRELNRRLGRNYKLNVGAMIFRPLHAALGGRLRLAVSGGAALPNRIAEFFDDIGVRLLQGYGLTEAAPVLCAAPPDGPLKIGSVGKPLAGIEIKLKSENGSDVGEIVARGPNVMAGYYRDKAATDAVLKDGWLHTGDLGRIDEDGYLYVVGRAKDVIVDSGGASIYIDELEEAYGHSPYLKELAVVGLSAPGTGEQVAALVVPAYARGQSRNAIQDRLREHFDKVSEQLSPHKRVKILRFYDGELPRTRTRKTKRAEVAAIIRRMVEPGGAPSLSGGEVSPSLEQALAQLSINGTKITSATRLIEDLGLDSLALAELAEHLAGLGGRELRPEELSGLKTVADLQAAVSSDAPARPVLPSYAELAQPFTPNLPAALRRLGESALRGSLELVLERWLEPRVLGRGNVPANRNVLVIANHSSHFDFALVRYALGKIGDSLVVAAAKDYFFNTPLRRFVAANFSPLIPIDRERAQLESLEEALGILRSGRSLLLFPEGTRSPDGKVHEFKSGAGYLALQSGCDVLPIYLKGTYDVLGKGKLVPQRHPVEVRIGPVITNQQLRKIADHSEGAGAYRDLAESLRRSVLALADESRSADARSPKVSKRSDLRAAAAAGVKAN